MPETPEILTEKRGSALVVTLNRPAVLNALSLGMIRGIRQILADSRDDDGVRAIIFQGAGGKAFCAGGDIKAVYQAGVGEHDPAQKASFARTYFADEYRMNRELYEYSKPLIAVMDGITMGGGFGLAGPCRYRIATERTVFAMPEVGIGFFPDVGSMYFLSRVPDRIGQWLALTGEKVTGFGMRAAGLATHFMMSQGVQDCLNDIYKNDNDVNRIIESHDLKHDLKTETSRSVSKIISLCFDFNTVEMILDALDKNGDPFAVSTAQTIRSRSPTSVKLAQAYYQWAGSRDFYDITAMDYRLAIRCALGSEFYEGVRAAVIDKDRQPRWFPVTLAGVSDDVIANYFSGDLPDLDDLSNATDKPQ